MARWTARWTSQRLFNTGGLARACALGARRPRLPSLCYWPAEGARNGDEPRRVGPTPRKHRRRCRPGASPLRRALLATAASRVVVLAFGLGRQPQAGSGRCHRGRQGLCRCCRGAAASATAAAVRCFEQATAPCARHRRSPAVSRPVQLGAATPECRRMLRRCRGRRAASTLP